jgi:hypothetical protein
MKKAIAATATKLDFSCCLRKALSVTPKAAPPLRKPAETKHANNDEQTDSD